MSELTGLDVEAVLRDHDWFTPRGYAWPCCNCGEEFTGGEDAAYAHVAAVLRVEIESALGDAWDEGARHGWGLFDMAFRYVERDNPYRPTLAATEGEV